MVNSLWLTVSDVWWRPGCYLWMGAEKYHLHFSGMLHTEWPWVCKYFWQKVATVTVDWLRGHIIACVCGWGLLQIFHPWLKPVTGLLALFFKVTGLLFKRKKLYYTIWKPELLLTLPNKVMFILGPLLFGCCTQSLRQPLCNILVIWVVVLLF
jgi:hypothetical protein